MMRLLVEKIEGYHLKPGDLFTTYTPEQVRTFLDRGDTQITLFVKTNAELDNTQGDGEYVHRVTIERIDEEGQLTQRTLMDPNAPPGVKQWSR